MMIEWLFINGENQSPIEIWNVDNRYGHETGQTESERALTMVWTTADNA